jgi:predicted nuclease with TOPRIM domain
MSVDEVDILNGIKEKVQSVRIRLDKQLGEYEALKKTNEDLNKIIQQNQAHIAELEQQNQKLKLAKSFLAESDDVHDARIKINKIVREIDKCIALLNR